MKEEDRHWRHMPEATRTVRETDAFAVELETTSLEPCSNGRICIHFKHPSLWFAFHIRQTFRERNLENYKQIARNESERQLAEAIDHFLTGILKPQLQRAAADIIDKHYCDKGEE